MLRRSSTNPDNEARRSALGAVVDPVFFHRLDELEMLREVHLTRSLRAVLAVPTEHYPASTELARRVQEAIDLGPNEVELTFEALDEAGREAFGSRLKSLEAPTSASATPASPGQPAGRPNSFSAPRSTTRVLAIASGKGGVGKSTVTVNLAVALAASGQTVGLLDADIYGFSVPRMLGVGYPPIVAGHTIIPPVAHGVRCVSMGFFVDEEKAVAWRGPMLHKALEQFLVDVHWGELDFLLVDMPPGTGDVSLSIAQQLPRAELYVVTTPQPAAKRVAQRAGAFARQVRMPLRGVIENMSYFEAPDGTHYELFGAGGGEALAKTLNVPLLSRLPQVLAVRAGGDEGLPIALAEPDGEMARRFDELAEKIVALGPARVYRSELSVS